MGLLRPHNYEESWRVLPSKYSTVVSEPPSHTSLSCMKPHLTQELHGDLMNVYNMLHSNYSLFTANSPLLLILVFFIQYNGTFDGSYNVYTGKEDISKVGVIDRWKGER